MQKQTYQEAVLKCVIWWSDKAFRTNANQDNGTANDAGHITHLLLNMVSMEAQKGITPEKITRFETKLTELLMKCENTKKYDRELSVDYTPCEFLFEAAKFTEIPVHCFPVKSNTFIDDNNRAFAKYQYGGQRVEI